MPQTRLSNYWCSNIYLQKEAATAQNQFMKGLAKYIDTDVKFLGTFTGVNPDGATLTTNLEMKVSSGPLASETVICTDPAGGDGEAFWIQWLTIIYSKVDADCSLIPEIFVPTTPLPCWKLVGPGFSRSSLLAAYQGNEKDPQGPCLDALARGVMADLAKDYIPVFPGEYTEGAYTGEFTVTSVLTP